MKLIIQIPCWDEEETLPRTVAELPRQTITKAHTELAIPMMCSPRTRTTIGSL